ncbi:hypothetical protein TNIN_479641 [Trichonephila inaurata madagascariensis]|uniref:DUF4817 domain-containing protein n=1 Tax=Trichonephila inaurata madagascariensis TaxID=2747483 RepID=A0A8X6WZJ8_9ARAC|nr:hypothetical protein TNIN_479641 [Trichonephila inaurata madagascariensis]
MTQHLTDRNLQAVFSKMPNLITKQRIFIVKIFDQNGSSAKAIRRRFDLVYGTQKYGESLTISDLIRKFEEHGTVHDRQERNVEPPKTATPEENVF